jgi:N-acetylglucosaminyldiphosphoundecaprenol N-acetyl-beta-D-mannosaminyltransferase
MSEPLQNPSPESPPARNHLPQILGMNVNPTSYAEASRTIMDWAEHGLSRYVCVATVNNVMESWDSPAFRKLTNQADMVTPDGMPLVWGLRMMGFRNASRVYGPDLTPIVLQLAADSGVPVGFYGSTQDVLDKIAEVTGRLYPALKIAYSWSPPFRPLTPEEDETVVTEINKSGARILFIGLNTPKQDFWMAAHRNRVQAVMLGVGAAFDFIAGSKPQAPRWMMRAGLEWIFRLATEPRRLWKRYLKHNPRFLALFACQLAGFKIEK